MDALNPGKDYRGFLLPAFYCYSKIHYSRHGAPHPPGQSLDGRAATLEEQACARFLNPLEMANADESFLANIPLFVGPGPGDELALVAEHGKPRFR